MKMSTQITLFFVAFNAFAGLVIATGVAGEIGVNVETGDPQQLEEISSQDEVSLGNNVGGTLFAMYNQLTQQVATLFYSVTPGLAMLRLFLPDLWVDLVLSPLAVIVVTKDLIAFARGTDL